MGSIPDQPYRRFTPPPWYEAAWNMTWNICTSTLRAEPKQQYENIKWFSVHGDGFNYQLDQRGDVLAGMAAGNAVYIAETYTDIPYLIIHEILHAQGIKQNNDGTHHPIFDECYECIRSVTVSTQHGKRVPCIGNSDILTKIE